MQNVLGPIGPRGRIWAYDDPLAGTEPIGSHGPSLSVRGVNKPGGDEPVYETGDITKHGTGEQIKKNYQYDKQRE